MSDLEARAKSGDTEAACMLGAQSESAGDTRMARGWYAHAARAGSVAGLRALAKNLLTQEPIVGSDGVAMLGQAAEKGDAEAAYLCALVAAQDDALADRFVLARQHAAHAEERGWLLARDERALLEKMGTTFEDMAAPQALQMVRPRIAIIENFISQDLCRWLIGRAEPLLDRATVYDPEGGDRKEDSRNNSAAHFGFATSDLILHALRARIAATAKMPLTSLERTAVLHYAPGEQFSPHYDFLNPRFPTYAREIAERGQRTATFLIYLNDAFEGGETDFPTLGYKFRGKPGDAILFWNVDEAGEPDHDMLHAGAPPTSGEKWLLSQWLRVPPRAV